MQRDVPQLVGEFLDSLRTYIGSGEVDLSAGLTLSKKSLDGMGAPLALLLEHGAKVIVVDNLSTGNDQNLATFIDDIEFINKDVCDCLEELLPLKGQIDHSDWNPSRE